MSHTEPLTDVIFRRYPNGEILAIFPGIAGACHAPNTCSYYQFVGQHGHGDFSAMMNHTHPATPLEYEALKTHLESDPYFYRFRVLKRSSRKHYEQRLAACR